MSLDGTYSIGEESFNLKDFASEKGCYVARKSFFEPSRQALGRSGEEQERPRVTTRDVPTRASHESSISFEKVFGTSTQNMGFERKSASYAQEKTYYSASSSVHSEPVRSEARARTPEFERTSEDEYIRLISLRNDENGLLHDKLNQQDQHFKLKIEQMEACHEERTALMIKHHESELHGLRQRSAEQLEGFRKENAALKDAVRESKRVLDSQLHQLNVLANRFDLQHANLHSRNAELTQLEQDLKAANERIRSLQYEVETKEDLCTEYKNRIAQMQDNLEARIDANDRGNSTMRLENARLKQDLVRLERLIAEAQQPAARRSDPYPHLSADTMRFGWDTVGMLRPTGSVLPPEGVEKRLMHDASSAPSAPVLLLEDVGVPGEAPGESASGVKALDATTAALISALDVE